LVGVQSTVNTPTILTISLALVPLLHMSLLLSLLLLDVLLTLRLGRALAFRPKCKVLKLILVV
jgi:hypothetical protein